MLYYNSISEAGKEWNIIKDTKSDSPQVKMGYIARFKLIKNIPFDSLVGLWVNLKYEKKMQYIKVLAIVFLNMTILSVNYKSDMNGIIIFAS